MLGNHGRSLTQTIFTPVARLLAAAHVTPNPVTVAGTLCVTVAAIATLPWGYLWQGGVLLGVLLFCDSLDGVLARMTGTGSTFGAFLDSTMDRLGDGAVFGSLLAYAVWTMPDSHARTVALIAGIVSMVAVGMVPYARARAESVGVIAKVGIAERTDRLIVALVGAALFDWGLSPWFFAGGLIWVAFASLVTVAQRVLFTARALRDASVEKED